VSTQDLAGCRVDAGMSHTCDRALPWQPKTGRPPAAVLYGPQGSNLGSLLAQWLRIVLEVNGEFPSGTDTLTT